MDKQQKSLSRDRRVVLWNLLAVLAGSVTMFGILPEPLFDAEEWLWRHFHPTHADAFKSVNTLLSRPALAIFVTWFGVASSLFAAKRFNLLIVNVLGPVVATLIIFPFEDLGDPEWFKIGAVTTIGCFIGLLVTWLWSFK
jgi:hypothetical protein